MTYFRPSSNSTSPYPLVGAVKQSKSFIVLAVLQRFMNRIRCNGTPGTLELRRFTRILIMKHVLRIMAVRWRESRCSVTILPCRKQLDPDAC